MADPGWTGSGRFPTSGRIALTRLRLVRHSVALAGALTCAVLLAPAVATTSAATTHAATKHASTRSAASTSPSCPWLNQSLPVSQRENMLMSAMTLPDKINMLTGGGFSEPYVFTTPGIPSLCIPQMGQEDGPLGPGDGLTLSLIHI